MIKQKFKPLNDELFRYYKSKHQWFWIRLIFKMLNDTELRVYIERILDDSSIKEVNQFIAGSRRDNIYSLANKRFKSAKQF